MDQRAGISDEFCFLLFLEIPLIEGQSLLDGCGCKKRCCQDFFLKLGMSIGTCFRYSRYVLPNSLVRSRSSR